MAIFVDRNCIDESSIYESFEDMNDLNLQAYNEVYFGDSTIEPILDAFSKFRKTWVGKPFNLKINYDPNLLKFNRLIENKFGFYRFSLTIDPTMDLNAYMMNVEFMSDTDLSSVGKNLVVKDGHGFRYSKDSGISALACVFYGLLCDGRFSDREIIAVLLHEIGHTFTFAVLNRNGEMLTRAKAAFCRVLSNLMRNNLTGERDFSHEKVEKDISSHSNILASVKNIFTKIKMPNISKMISSVRDMAGNAKYSGYTNEKFADTFASMYGYGSELTSCLQKMDQHYIDKYAPKRTPGSIEIAYKIMKWNFWDNLFTVLNLKDEHPEGLTRIHVQIQYLERELAKQSIDPKMKLELQRQLAEQKALVEEFINYTGDPDGYKARRVYYAQLYEKYGGDRREKYTNNDAIFGTIDDTYDNLK